MNWHFLITLPSYKSCIPLYSWEFWTTNPLKGSNIEEEHHVHTNRFDFLSLYHNLDFAAFKVIWGFACSFINSRAGVFFQGWPNFQSLSEIPQIPWIYFSKDFLMQLPTAEMGCDAFLELLVASAAKGVLLFSWQVCTETAQTPKFLCSVDLPVILEFRIVIELPKVSPVEGRYKIPVILGLYQRFICVWGPLEGLQAFGQTGSCHIPWNNTATP